MNYVEKRNHKDNDSIFLITGYEGTGKSALASHISHRLDRQFTTDRVIFYDPNAWWEQIEDESWYKSLWLDEALHLLLSYEWGTKQAKSILKETAFCRYKRKYIVLCLPNIGWCNKYLREHRVMFWIHVVKRGLAKFRMRKFHEVEPNEWWKKWTVLGTMPYPDFPYNVKLPYTKRKKKEKDQFLKHGGEITIGTVVKMLGDGVFGTVINEDMPARDIEDMLHMVLQRDLPYSQFRAGDITRAVRIWLT